MKRIAVYCGSSPGASEEYESEAYVLGKTLAQKEIGLVYGGAKVGLMGAVASGTLSHNGEVIGVIPGFLKTKEVAHTGLTQLIEVKSMHERKTKMNDLSDGIIALPGGYGTLEELFEMITWAQLGLHQKPIGILNINGFYNFLIQQIYKMFEAQFIKEQHIKLLIIGDSINDLLDKMNAYQPIVLPKWITKDKT